MSEQKIAIFEDFLAQRRSGKSLADFCTFESSKNQPPLL